MLQESKYEIFSQFAIQNEMVHNNGMEFQEINQLCNPYYHIILLFLINIFIPLSFRYFYKKNIQISVRILSFFNYPKYEIFFGNQISIRDPR